MKVILLNQIHKLGKEGEAVEVKDGYARNYLIPSGLALAATESNYKKLEALQRVKQKAHEAKKQHCLELKKKIEALSLTVATEAKESEELYGSINQAQVNKLLLAEEIVLDKGVVQLPEPINKLGVYNLPLELHPDVVANLRLWVMKK